MICAAILAAVWLASGVCSYRLIRYSVRKKFDNWTVSDRHLGLFLICFGPGALVAAFLALLSSIGDTPNASKESKW